MSQQLRQGPDRESPDRLMTLRAIRSRSRRRVIRRRRQVAVAGLFLCGTLIAMAGSRLLTALTDDPVAGSDTGSGAAAMTAARPAGSSPTSRTPTSLRSAAGSSTSTLVSTPPATTATVVYSRAPGGTVRHGSGTLRTYRVEVETGTGLSAPAFAAAVDATLDDPAGWTGQGRWSLQRVDRDKVDMVIRLATPATVDEVCARAGLDTRGYVSCRSGHFVMINLDRWLKAVPDYRGDVARYRQYVVNHEVGHQLGYPHQLCPGPGRLAPVMQQQTIGLKGCLVNGWPYVDGRLVSGPETE